MGRPAKPVAARLEERLDRSGGPNACHLWTGSTANGYGVLGIKSPRATKKTHRLAWELANGPIPDGLCVLHRCDVRACCNVAHLFLGTLADNIADMVAKGRQARGPTKRSVRGEAHAHARLTTPMVVALRTRLAAGETGRSLATEYGIAVSTVSAVKTRRLWKHVA